MENRNIQKETEADLQRLVRKYNVLSKRQLYAYFALDGREGRVGRALKALEREGMAYILEGMVAANETSYKAWERGREQAFWVLLSLMGQMKVAEHFPVSAEEHPVRIVFTADGGLYDILYVPESDVTLTNRLYLGGKKEEGSHVIVVESAGYIRQIHVEDTIGYAKVKEGGEVEYYKKTA
ncbi:MAG: DUF5697 family protein [Lachnospiraceae bacterium]|nr:DUF5697 family protein [Lachnospiraceae bacterium]